jgi:NADH-quinone oxidoreductase subunit G
MPNVTIDGKQIEVPAGTTIIQAADKLGINIPRYCYHPALPVSGNCRICMVEVEKNPKQQIACYTQVTDGMVVHTHSPKAVESRKSVLEFLLVNHPVDCPVCDQAGECKLQDYYMEHGKYDSRLSAVKVRKEKKAFEIGPTVMLDQERCILCTRCVRFAENITKTNEFGVFSRGDHSQLDLYPGKVLDNNYSGNVVDICPVGALTDSDFRFKCRVWYLAATKSVCPGCSQGCNITVEWDKTRPHQRKKGRVMRLKPRLNPQVNDYWMCDEGRYNYHFIDENRILHPQLIDDLISWEKAIDTLAINILNTKPEKIAVLASAQLTNEDYLAVRKLFKDKLKGVLVGTVPDKPGKADDFLLKADRNPNTAGLQTILQPDTDGEQIIGKAKKGELDVLYVLGQDLVKLCGKDTVSAIARKVKLLVYQGTNVNETCGYAHLNLPSNVYAEKDGTFTNGHKRVQRIHPAFAPLGESKSDWQIISMLSAKLGGGAHHNAEDLFKEIAAGFPAFAEMTYEKIGDQGMVLKS